jgi:transposase
VSSIEAVALDPHCGYANGLIEHCGAATVVLDHFHAIALANKAVHDVRRRTQQAMLGHRGRSGDPLYSIRRLLVTGYQHLSTRQWARIEAGLAAGDPWGEVGAAFMAKELLREVYDAIDPAHARRRLTVFYQWVADAEVPELTRLAHTISAWQNELLAFFDTAGLSNAATEGLNLLIKKIKRVGHGFRNFDDYRLRLLLHCGVDWNTHRTARLRARPPRSIA